MRGRYLPCVVAHRLEVELQYTVIHTSRAPTVRSENRLISVRVLRAVLCRRMALASGQIGVAHAKHAKQTMYIIPAS